MRIWKAIKNRLLKPVLLRLKQKRHVVVVLGMHRSGTSALTEAMANSGLPLKLGDKLLGPKSENPRGYFEDIRIVKANQDFFRTFNTNYLEPWKLPTVVTTEGIEKIQKVWSALEREKINMIKDPRLCVTLPQWQAAWRHDAKPLYVHIWRHPAQVANSLWRRAQVPVELSEQNWVFHIKSALRHADLNRSVFLMHSDLISVPAETIDSAVHEISKLTKWKFAPSTVISVDQSLVTTDVPDMIQTPEAQALWEALVLFQTTKDLNVLRAVIKGPTQVA